MAETLDIKQLIKGANAAYKAENYKEAANLFLAAEERYRSLGDLAQSAEMANNRSVCLLQADDPEGAFQAVDGTIEIFLEVGDQKLQAMALGNRASALGALKRHDEAVLDYEKAADILKQLGENDLYVQTTKALSATLMSAGRQMEAVAVMQSAMNKVDKPTLKERFVKKLLSIPFNFLPKSADED